MTVYFSPTVDKALEDIYYCYDKERALRAKAALETASREGDGDASYILSRCCCGPQYSWKYHPFEEDDQKAEELVRLSIRQGSAMGVLGSMRLGLLTPELEAGIPFPTLMDAWNAVAERGRAGCLFAQMMIGNTFFWLDIVRIQGASERSFPDKAAFAAYLRKSELNCIPWFESAVRGGMGFAARNLWNLYNDGDGGTFQPQPEKARALVRECAGLGYPEWQEQYGKELIAGGGADGVELCRKAAEQGQLSAWFYVGKAYQEGKLAEKNVPYALECYLRGVEDPGEIGCRNRAGELLFLGQNGITQDYVSAVRLFEEAHALGNRWANDMLGVCCLQGYGCMKDPVRARELFEEADYSSNLKSYGLGLIYADGLGVPEDIEKGAAYLERAGTYAPAQRALERFKKTLFGKWKRR